jgi:hypothetical protein
MFNQAKWLITGTAFALTNPPAHGTATLTPAIAAAVLGGYTVLLLAAATHLLRHRDVT